MARGEANKEDIVVGTCNGPLDQEKEENEAFLKQFEEVSWLHAVVFMGIFNHFCFAGRATWQNTSWET